MQSNHVAVENSQITRLNQDTSLHTLVILLLTKISLKELYKPRANSNFLIADMLRLQSNRARLRKLRFIGIFGKHLILVGVNLIQRTPQITIESTLMEAIQSLQTNIEKYFSI